MKASIIIITYNHAKYIEQAIEGIRIQKDCPELEIIFCDDCSTDDTVAIATNLLKNLPNVQIHAYEKNAGITKNYQRAFSLCKGEFIFVLEGDDFWIDPYKIKKQIEFLEKHPECSMVSHLYNAQYDETHTTTPAAVFEKAYELFESADLIMNPAILNNFTTCCYRRSALEKISPQTYEVISFDWMINISIGNFGKLGRINSPLSVYRISSNGTWQKLSQQEQLNGMIGIIDEYDRVLETRYAATFAKKKRMLEDQLASLNGTKKKRSNFFKTFLQFLFLQKL
jgi:glycosyltransferase involved in cell wall biosynthesis